MMAAQAERPWFTPQEVAALLDISGQTLRNWLTTYGGYKTEAGEILPMPTHAEMIGTRARVVFDRAAIEAVAAARAAERE